MYAEEGIFEGVLRCPVMLHEQQFENVQLAGVLKCLKEECWPSLSLDGSCRLIGESWLVGGKIVEKMGGNTKKKKTQKNPHPLTE